MKDVGEDDAGLDPAMSHQAEQDQFHELSYYTLAHPGSFIHQHIVDAYAAQLADAHTKPIKITFALVGLYLHVEEGYSGREVQRVHMLLAKLRKTWPQFIAPRERGEIRVSDVLEAAPGPDRDQAIEMWCNSVWAAWRGSREQVRHLLETVLHHESP